MSTHVTVPIDSKSAKKRKAKAETVATTGGDITPVAEATLPTSEFHSTANGFDSLAENAFIKELIKCLALSRYILNTADQFFFRNIRNVNKKISSAAKADAVVAENPGVSIDDLVSQKKLNADQKAQVLKKPALQAQVTQLEEQLAHFRAFAHELEEQAAKEKLILVEAHETEIARVKEEAKSNIEGSNTKAVEDALHVIIQFLHAAASKRQVEDAESDEARAFEGALLLVYQGNETALSTLKDLIYGTDVQVADVQGESLDFTFAQVKASSMQSADDLVQTTEPEKEDDVTVPAEVSAPEMGTDTTVANAGLTEIDNAILITEEAGVSKDTADVDVVSLPPEQTSTGELAANAVAEAWDPQASVTDTSATNDEWVQVPRDPAETETGIIATPAVAPEASNSWAEEVGAAATSVDDKTETENDGFEQVRRERGRGRGGRGGRGEFRGRGRGGREGHRGGGRGGREGQNGSRGGRGPRGENKS